MWFQWFQYVCQRAYTSVVSELVGVGSLWCTELVNIGNDWNLWNHWNQHPLGSSGSGCWFQSKPFVFMGGSSGSRCHNQKVLVGVSSQTGGETPLTVEVQSWNAG